ncbi:hypothetical protein ACHQM5_001375 [Ranunculus cassubicifolius]
MKNKFNAAIKIKGDLNDLSTTSQACVIKKEPRKFTPLTNPVAMDHQKEKVTIATEDCLACSGCVTSVDTVKSPNQSLDELLSSLETGKEVIVSLSPQSRASLAAHFGLSPLEVFRKVTTFFKSLGVKAVYDTSCSRDLSLIESFNEFFERYNGGSSESPFPMIASSCPSWIYDAEKLKMFNILPYISSVKSPQQAIGAIIKHHVCPKLGIELDKVFHLTIMPCHEKKVEAARDDFIFSVEAQGDNASEQYFSEVDLVMTTEEVVNLIQLKAVDFKGLEESSLDKLLTNVDDEGYLYGVTGSSGGYAETIFRHAAKTIFGRHIEGPLNFKRKRNSDFQEVTLEVEGKTVLKVAVCYGSKNVSTIVNNIKIGKCDYHFVEIMTCPGGCVNGSSQIKSSNNKNAKTLLESVEKVYMKDVLVADPFENSLVKSIYDEWLERPGSEKAKKHIHTKYHPVANSLDW